MDVDMPAPVKTNTLALSLDTCRLVITHEPMHECGT